MIGNTSSPTSKFNGPYNAVDRSNEAMFNQGYLIVERFIPTDGSWGTGGRLDLLYGEDFFLAVRPDSSFAPTVHTHWNPQYYGLAIPQAYGEFGNDVVSIKAGHFYTPIGYEGVPAPNNFFYSKAYSYQFAGPFTHWGALATAKLSEGWKAELGLVNGWNASTAPRTSSRRLLFSDTPPTNGGRGSPSSRAMSSTTTPGCRASPRPLRTARPLSLDRRLAAGGPMGVCLPPVVRQPANGTASGATAYWYGIDQYLYYRINDCWRSALRFEWFRDEDGTRVGLNRPSNPNKPPFVGSFFSLTAGVNWTPSTNFTLRPEIRADWFDGNQAIGPFDDGAKNYQLMIGFDAIYLF